MACRAAGSLVVAAGAGGGAGGWTGGGGSAGGLSELECIFTTVPAVIDHPAARAERRCKLRNIAVVGDQHIAGAAGLICCGVADSMPGKVRRCAMAKL